MGSIVRFTTINGGYEGSRNDQEQLDEDLHELMKGEVCFKQAIAIPLKDGDTLLIVFFREEKAD